MPMPGSCDGCEPVAQELVPPTTQRFRDGKPISPIEATAEQIAKTGSLAVQPTPESSIPTWAIEIMNNVRSLHLEVVSLALAMQRRGLITEAELAAARTEVTTAVEKEFRSLAEGIARSRAQRPVHYPPTIHTQDPRRTPQG